MANQQLPPTYATPTAVRDFLATLLRDHHAVPESEAREIASKWRLGRGSELISIGVETYRAILGAEVGAILFGYVRKISRNQKQGQNQTDSAGNRPKRKEAPKTDIFGLEPEMTMIWFFLSLTAILAYGVLFWEPNFDESGSMGSLASVSAFCFIASYFLFYFR